MYSIFLKTVDAHCPHREYHISKKRPPYITPEIVALSHDRDYHHKMAAQASTPDHVAYHYQLAISLRKAVNHAIKQSKRNYILDQFELCKKNPTKFWSTDSSLLPSVKSNVIEGVFSKENNSFLTGLQAANEINSFFINVGLNLNTNLPPSADDSQTTFEALSSCIEQMTEISIYAIENKLDMIDTSKSLGIPKVNSKLLKIALLNQKVRFCKLLNLCIKMLFCHDFGR